MLADLLGCDQRAEVHSEAIGAGAVGFRGGQGDPVSAGAERGPKAHMREDIPVGAHSRQDNVHGKTRELSGPIGLFLAGAAEWKPHVGRLVPAA
jgi:hypothetical protein